MKINTMRTMMVSTVVHYNTAIYIGESMSYDENLYTYCKCSVILLSIGSIFEGLQSTGILEQLQQ